MKRSIAAFVLLLAVADSARAQAGELILSGDNEASAGYYALQWRPADGQELPVETVFELEEATDADFGDARTLYVGSDRARTVSGQHNGTYYYRVRLAGEQIQPWSEPHSVTVAHHSLTEAFSFFAVGAVVFVATLALVLVGSRRAAT